MIEHPEIAWIQRTGYPSWLQPGAHDHDDDDYDEDAAYEERRDREIL